jgi:hypothetical protein
MVHTWVSVLFVLAVAVVACPVVASAGQTTSAETPEETQTTSPVETTTTPDDGPAGHADDPFPSWLPLLYAGGLLVGIAAVGGTLWFVVTRVRGLLGK